MLASADASFTSVSRRSPHQIYGAHLFRRHVLSRGFISSISELQEICRIPAVPFVFLIPRAGRTLGAGRDVVRKPLSCLLSSPSAIGRLNFVMDSESRSRLYIPCDNHVTDVVTCTRYVFVCVESRACIKAIHTSSVAYKVVKHRVLSTSIKTVCRVIRATRVITAATLYRGRCASIIRANGRMDRLHRVSRIGF